MTSEKIRQEQCDEAGAEVHETARHIARVASELFAGRGFAATPVRAIAEAAGVTCPTLYYHFKNKEGLAQELLMRPSTEVVSVLRGYLDDETLDPVARLVHMADALLDFSRESPERARFLYAVMFGPADEALANEVDRFARQISMLLIEAANRVASAGVVRPGRAADLARSVRGLVIVHTMDFLYRDGALGPELAGKLVTDILLGLAEPEARIALSERHRAPSPDSPCE